MTLKCSASGRNCCEFEGVAHALRQLLRPIGQVIHRRVTVSDEQDFFDFRTLSMRYCDGTKGDDDGGEGLEIHGANILVGL